VHIAVVSGETSGDQLGGGILKALQERIPQLKVSGVGGANMTAAGLDSLYAMDDISLMGVDGFMGKIRKALYIRRALYRRFTADPPDIFLGIDIPDFNLVLERRLRRFGIPVVHLVSPTVWAWRSYRIHRIRKAVDHMLVLFPFEEAYYRANGVPATFVGHPAADEIGEVDQVDAQRQLARLGVSVTGELVALLPGSRASEIRHLAPVFIDTAMRLSQIRPGIRFVVPYASHQVGKEFEKICPRGVGPEYIQGIQGNARMAMAGSDLVLLASGTAALEAALLARPMVVAYKVSGLSYVLARMFAKVKQVSMPNHLTARPMVPEFLQGRARPDLLCGELDRLLDERSERTRIEESFRDLRGVLKNDACAVIAEKLVGIAQSRVG